MTFLTMPPKLRFGAFLTAFDFATTSPFYCSVTSLYSDKVLKFHPNDSENLVFLPDLAEHEVPDHP